MKYRQALNEVKRIADQGELVETDLALNDRGRYLVDLLTAITLYDNRKFGEPPKEQPRCMICKAPTDDRYCDLCRKYIAHD